MTTPSLQDHIREVNLLKYEISEQMEAETMELEWLTEYHDLLRRARADLRSLEELAAKHPEPAVVGESALPGFDDQIDTTVRRAVASAGAVLEVMNMLCQRHETKVKIYAMELEVARSMPASDSTLASLLMANVLEAERDKMMVSKTRRSRFCSLNREAISYSLRCLIHTYSRLYWKHPDFVADSGYHAIIEAVCFLKMATPSMIQSFVHHLQNDPAIPSSLMAVVLLTALQSRSVPALQVVDPDAILTRILRSHRLYRISDETSHVSTCISLVLHLSAVVDLGLWPVHGDLARLKQVGFVIVELIKTLGSATTLSTAGLFPAVCYKILTHMFSRREDLLCSFLNKHVTVSILEVTHSPTDPHLQVLFAVLSSRPVFHRSVAASLTPDMEARLALLVPFGAMQHVREWVRRYTAALAADTEGHFTDNLTGCIIAMPGVIHPGGGDPVWVDAFDFEALLHNKPQNPYTREEYSPDNFTLDQLQEWSAVATYTRELDAFIMSAARTAQ